MKHADSDTYTVENKRELLLQDPNVQRFVDQFPEIRQQLDHSPFSHQVALLSLIACGGGEELIEGIKNSSCPGQDLADLLETLYKVEEFYAPLGGIVGYYQEMCRLMKAQKKKESVQIEEPPGVCLEQTNSFYQEKVREGLQLLPHLVCFFPVGGAGDRLMLKHERTGELLPAACLKFAGKTLLEGLFRDLQAQEYLYEKLFHEKIVIPVVLMTSIEKNNHQLIVRILEENHWFNRPQESFHFVIQPMAPVLTAEEKWAYSSPLKLVLKPGGHGVLWKLTADAGILSLLCQQGFRKGLVRQINNPLASLDGGLLAFAGVGASGDKEFGFASCERLLHASEGMIVLMKRGDECCLTNIEYTDFCHYGIKDLPKQQESPYSKFPSNTNILFCDLQAIQQMVRENPFPGKIVNMKSQAKVLDQKGEVKEVAIGRLETTMQNIADGVIAKQPTSLRSFVTFAERKKTISVTKRSYTAGKPMEETPVGCFYDLLSNMHALLQEKCKVNVPPFSSPQEYLEKGPSLIFLFHPALGPLWSIIGQKWRGGSIAKGGEIQLELADWDCEQLHLKGSLLIRSSHPLQAKCTLRNVTVHNQGIDREKSCDYWKNEYVRHETLEIYLEGNGEFYAEGVTFIGSFFIEVPAHHRMIARQEGKEVTFHLEKIEGPTWKWDYQFSSQDEIKITNL